jgi:hypothetical protein
MPVFCQLFIPGRQTELNIKKIKIKKLLDVCTQRIVIKSRPDYNTPK